MDADFVTYALGYAHSLYLGVAFANSQRYPFTISIAVANFYVVTVTFSTYTDPDGYSECYAE